MSFILTLKNFWLIILGSFRVVITFPHCSVRSITQFFNCLSYYNAPYSWLSIVEQHCYQWYETSPICFIIFYIDRTYNAHPSSLYAWQWCVIPFLVSLSLRFWAIKTIRSWIGQAVQAAVQDRWCGCRGSSCQAPPCFNCYSVLAYADLLYYANLERIYSLLVPVFGL